MVQVALPFGIGTPEGKRVWYREALRAAGVEPVENVTSLDGLGGLALAGGTDVDPAIYGEARRLETQEPDTVRDRIETALIREALARDLPVFAICRGMQLLNAVLGGTLAQHISGHDCRKRRDAHTVQIAPGSRLASILGSGEYVVNSRHHQAVGRVADCLAVTAAAADGTVEAVELPSARFVVAVQWHPEARTSGPDLKLFEAFRAALHS